MVNLVLSYFLSSFHLRVLSGRISSEVHGVFSFFSACLSSMFVSSLLYRETSLLVSQISTIWSFSFITFFYLVNIFF